MPQRKAIGEQHEEIMLALQRLRVAAAWDGNMLSEAHLRRVLVLDLEGLLDLLRAHFAFEEEGGYLSWLVEGRPETKPEVDRLEREHAVILGKLEDLVRGAETAALVSMKDGIIEVLQSLEKHEAAERAVIGS